MRTLETINARLSYGNILLAFWAFFWLLNGLDKFCNAEFFFGVTRDSRFIELFAQLGLSPKLALGMLYTCGVVEALLGVGFFYVILRPTMRFVLAEITFKISMLIFFAFSVGDILFGDRKELSEHATFLVLVIVSFLLVRWSAESRGYQFIGCSVRDDTGLDLLAANTKGQA